MSCSTWPFCQGERGVIRWSRIVIAQRGGYTPGRRPSRGRESGDAALHPKRKRRPPAQRSLLRSDCSSILMLASRLRAWRRISRPQSSLNEMSEPRTDQWTRFRRHDCAGRSFNLGTVVGGAGPYICRRLIRRLRSQALTIRHRFAVRPAAGSRGSRAGSAPESRKQFGGRPPR
jgi:hypothetical protein